MPISKEKKLMILDLLEAHEIAIYELYNIFASKYSYYEDFWRGIAEEEKVHARWVRTIRSKAETGDISIAADVVSISTIENSLEYLQSQISLFSSKESTVDQAFILAMQIENSIIERGIFDIIQTDSEITKNTLLNLVEKTRMHYSRIKDMAKKRTRLHGLIDSGFLSAGDLASAYDIAAKEGESIESVIIKIFKVSKKTILACISAFCKLPQWSLDSPNLSFPAGLSQMLAGKYEALKSELFVPVAAEGRKIIVAMANPEDIIKRDYIQKFFPNREVEFRVGITDDIAFAVDVFCGVNIDTTKKSMEAILHEMKSEAVAEPIAAGSDDLEIQENDSAVVRLVNNIIEDASNRGVSDIHIEPSLDGDVLVRYRIDGLMSRAHVFPRKFRNPVSARIKIMSELDITEKRKPQSGKIRFRRWGSKDIELRVETYTTASGAEDR